MVTAQQGNVGNNANGVKNHSHADDFNSDESKGIDDGWKKWSILTKEFVPPSSRTFKKFANKVGSNDTYVDVANPSASSFEAQRTLDGPTKIRIKYLLKNQPTSADEFPLWAEGNLESGGGGGPSQAHFWAAKVHFEGTVDIDADIDRDGTVENNDEDEDREESVGTVVIADKEGVYSDPDEPAKRRAIVLRRNSGTGNIRVKRNSGNLKLYDAATGGAEKFGGNDEVALAAGTYHLQGGPTPSTNVRDHHLKVREDADAAAYVDQINVTVLWVEISGDADPTHKFSPSSIYAGRTAAVNFAGGEDLGVQVNGTTATKVHGVVELQGDIKPSDLHFDRKITDGWTQPDDVLPAPVNVAAKAEFGFIFRRIEDVDIYANGNGTSIQHEDSYDDGPAPFQDVDPAKSASELLIFDIDGPTVTVTTTGGFFKHTRDNFTEHLVFNFHKEVPERCSKKLQWAFTGDTDLAYDDTAVYIFDEANDGNGANEVFVGSNLANTSINLANAPDMVTALTDPGGDKQIKRGQDVVIKVTGTHLVGAFTLEKGGTVISAKKVQVKRTDAAKNLSDLTEAKVTFNTNQAASAGWTLRVVNDKGNDTIGGFEIIN